MYGYLGADNMCGPHKAKVLKISQDSQAQQRVKRLKYVTWIAECL